MIVYVIKQNHDAAPAEVVCAGGIAARIDALSGRGCLSDGRGFSAYILGQIGRTDRYSGGRKRDSVYVAAARDSEARNTYGWRGFIVKRNELSGV